MCFFFFPLIFEKSPLRAKGNTFMPLGIIIGHPINTRSFNLVDFPHINQSIEQTDYLKKSIL